jgi:DNA-binding transcriptional ArsR family regulator
MEMTILTIYTVGQAVPTNDLVILEEPQVLRALLDPLRLRLLAALTSPDSASGLARRLGLARQQVNYHLGELEDAGLITPVEERRRGNCIERLVQASAAALAISPEVLGPLAADARPALGRSTLVRIVSAAGRVVRDVAAGWRAAPQVNPPVASICIEARVRPASPADANAFATELRQALDRLIARFDDPAAPPGAEVRLALLAYPAAPLPSARTVPP